MSMYLRQIALAPAGEAHTFAFAKNVSSCSDDTKFGPSVIDARGTIVALGKLGFPYGVQTFAAAGRVARGAVAGQDRGASRALVLDLDRALAAKDPIVATLELPAAAHRIALDGDGATLACIHPDRLVFYAVATKQEIASVPLSTERRFQGYVAWCAAGWVVVRATGRKWGLALLDAKYELGGEVALKGEPYTLAGASAAPVVAVGIGKATVSVIDLGVAEAKRKAVSTTMPPAKDKYAAVTVAIAADGKRVVARGTECEAVYVIEGGAKTAVEYAPAKSVTGKVGKDELLTTPGFAFAGARVVVYDGDTVAYTDR